MKSDLFDRFPLALILILVVLFFWRLSLSQQFTFADNPDLAYQVLPWYQVQAKAWHEGIFPMWDPYHWAGQSLLGQMQPGGAFPLNWPLFLAPLEDGQIQLRWVHWHFVLMHVLAALFMYGLVRELGRSRFASVLAAVAFGCGGYLAATNWPQKVNGAIWIPLIFLLFQRMERARDPSGRWINAVFCGGVIGMALLSGHHQNPMYALLALTGVFFYFLFERLRRSYQEAAGFAGMYLVIAGTAFVAAALQLLPAIEYGAESYRWVGAEQPLTMDQDVPYYAQSDLRLYAVTLLGMLVPHAHFQVSTFVGLVCLSLAIYAVGACWRQRWVRVYSCIALAALAYSLGPFSILHGWVYAAVPVIDKARAPAHAVFVFQFALFVLAAFGVDQLLRDRKSRPDGRWLPSIQRALVGIGASAWLLILYRYLDGKMTRHSGDQLAIAALAAFVLAALLHAVRRGSISAAAARFAIVALMLFEMGVAHSTSLSHRNGPGRPGHLDKLAEFGEVAEYLESRPKPFRFHIETEGRKPNIGGWEGLEMVDGYLASVSRDVLDFFRGDWERRRLMLNTVYTVSRDRVRESQVEVFRSSTGWKVFLNPDASPRAWPVHDTETIVADGEDPLPRPEGCGQEAVVTFQETSLHGVRAQARMPCAAYLVFGDAYFPGWKAYLDGEPATLYRAHGALRAVFVPAGEHEVEFVYRPASVILGATLTGLSLLGCLVLVLVNRRRDRRFERKESAGTRSSQPEA